MGIAEHDARTHPDQFVDVLQIVRKLFDVKPFAFGFPSAAKIKGKDREAGRRELLGRPYHVAAVGIESVNQDHGAARLTGGPPRPDKNLKSAYPFERVFSHSVTLRFRHWVSLSTI